MNADEARKRTVKEMIITINRCIKEGQYSVSVFRVVPDYLVVALEAKGFKVIQPREIKGLCINEFKHGTILW